MGNLEEKACLCALNKIFGFAPKIGLALISHTGSAAEVFRIEGKDMDELLGPHNRYRGLMSMKAVDQAAKELADMESRGISFVGWSDEDYPPLLQECEDAPIGLYVRSTTPMDELWKPQKRSFTTILRFICL